MKQQKSLSAIWRKLVLTTALSTSLMAGMPAMAQTTPNKAPAGNNPAAVLMLPQDGAVQNLDPAAAKELTRRVNISIALMEDARAHFTPVTRGAETGYARTLDSLDRSITLKLDAAGNKGLNAVALLDPARFDAALAIGFNPFNAVSKMLAEQEVHVSGDYLLRITKHMASPSPFRFGPTTITQGPAAFPLTGGNSTAYACVIVPSADANPYLIPGLTYQQRLSFINRHESWHCLDTGHDNAPDTSMNVPDSVQRQIFYRNVALQTQREAMSDVAAVGDMIRQENAGLDLIDTVSAWRRGNAKDNIHVSSPVLDGFKTMVEGYGVGVFREMTDAQATEVYQWAVQRYAHTEKSVQYIFEFRDLSRRDQMPYRGKHNADPEFQRAMTYLQIYDQKMADAPDPNRPLSDSEQVTFSQLKQYDAMKLLQDKAFELDGKVTPATMVHAYGSLREGLLKQLRADPDNAIYVAEITKLQQVLILGVARTDYVQANLSHSVDIVAKEPVLVSFRAPKTASNAPLQRRP